MSYESDWVSKENKEAISQALQRLGIPGSDSTTFSNQDVEGTHHNVDKGVDTTNAGSKSKTDVEFITYTNSAWPFSSLDSLKSYRSNRLSLLTKQSASESRAKLNPIPISILDSSFNPPTKAHKSLAFSQIKGKEHEDYESHMLLLSVTNADKKLKPGDATYAQRLEMMCLLANQLVRKGFSQGK
jgi:hypothetical protein